MANLLQAEDKPVEAVLPDEGSTGWSDTWMIAANAKHPNCMYMWMDHMASAEANGQATVWFGEAPTSPQACEVAEALSPGHCELTHATDEAYYDKIWYWSTPQEDCADDDVTTGGAANVFILGTTSGASIVTPSGTVTNLPLKNIPGGTARTDTAGPVAGSTNLFPDALPQCTIVAGAPNEIYEVTHQTNFVDVPTSGSPGPKD